MLLNIISFRSTYLSFDLSTITTFGSSLSIFRSFSSDSIFSEPSISRVERPLEDRVLSPLFSHAYRV